MDREKKQSLAFEVARLRSDPVQFIQAMCQAEQAPPEDLVLSITEASRGRHCAMGDLQGDLQGDDLLVREVTKGRPS